MDKTKEEMFCSMEEAKNRLVGLSDICLLLSEQRDPAVTNALLNYLGLAISDICKNYLDVEKWVNYWESE